MKVSQLKENIRNIVRKKLSEAVIDVTNPATETPATKKSKIDIARRTTGNKNLGTEKDPVEFIEEDDQAKPGQVDTKTLKNVKLKNGNIYKNVRFHMLNDPKSFVKSDGGYMINQDIASVVDANQELKETEEYTMARLRKMGRSELIDFLGLPKEDARNWSDRQLQGAALEMADDRPADEETVDEADYIDDDDTVHEGVDDDNTDFKDYDSVYEDMEDTSPNVDKYKLGEIERNNEFRANVGSGHRGVSVKLHPIDSRLIMISQDNGQRVVVEVEDVPELIEILRGLA